MLSDEEKEALRNFKSEYETCDHYSSDLIIELDDAEIILNLIEKQSKEIEELKDKCKELYNPSDMILRYYDTKKGTQVEIKGFVPTDKIKAKIEELEKDIQYSANPLSIDNSKFAIKVLQSLLEKE